MRPLKRQAFQQGLMASASGLALLAGGAVAPAQAAGPVRSLSQALAARAGANSAAVSPSAATAAAQTAATGVQNLAAASARFLSLQQALAQAAGTQSSYAASVPNGLATGGLQPAKGYSTPGSSTVWQGVSTTAPVTQSTANGITTVTINQAKPQAILNWQTFNVGSNTHVTFNQSAGGVAASTWSVLNRVTDPQANPTQIFGSITAPGQVLILNVNGVLFAPGAQVSLHSLVAGAVGITDTQYLQSGIYSPNNNGVLAFGFSSGTGVVDVAQGAQIITTAPASVTSGGGNVLLLGAGAINDGTIETPGGQTVLAAASQGFDVVKGYNITQSSSGSTSGNTNSTVLGSEVESYGNGIVVNRGLITSLEGDISLVGQTVQQYGVLMSATSVTRRGTIHLLNNLQNVSSTGVTTTNTGGTITLEPGSVTEILPDSSGTTALNAAQQTAYTAQTANTGDILLNNYAQLPDQPGLSRIEITSGGLVTFAPNSITLAPAGQIAVDSSGRIFAGSTAQLDVSGLTNVSVPMAENQLAVSVEPNNLRDSPVNNSTSGPLNSGTAYVDIRDLTQIAANTLVDPALRDYTSGGLLEVSGELGNVGHTESEWSTIGGTIYLYGSQVVAQPGSVFNISGGSESFQAGTIRQTYVIGPGGTVYNINTAPANLQYTGIYEGVQDTQPRWHVTDTYNNPLLAPAYIYDPGYTVGRDAGGIVLSTPTAVFAGSIEGGVIDGITQTKAQAAGLTDPFLAAQNAAPIAGTFTFGDFAPGTAAGENLYTTNVVINTIGSALAAQTSATSLLPASLTGMTTVSGTQTVISPGTAYFAAAQFDGLGGLSITVGDPNGNAPRPPSITIEAPLAMAAGAQVTLTAPVIDVKAPISAPSGTITLQTVNTDSNAVARTSITVSQGVALTTTGLFTNAVTGPLTASGAAFVNGGTITIDSSGALDLAAGSSIDTSAGAAVTTSGFSGGAGGSVSITANDPGVTEPSSLQPVTEDATITSYGVTTSGTLSLTVPQVLIAPYQVSHGNTAVVLAPSFFDAGFNTYVVNGFASPASSTAAPSVVVEPGTNLTVDVPVLIEAPTGSTAPSGAPGQGLVLYLPPEYVFNRPRDQVTQRTGASLTLESYADPTTPQGGTGITGAGGAVVVSQGSAITVDQGRSVTLQSFGQITEDGTINAPSGTISLLNLYTNQIIDAAQSALLSVWVGQHAVLNAAGAAETAVDDQGNSFGVVPGGGSIVVGGAGNFGNVSNASAAAAFVFVRPGAVLDASGTSAQVTVLGGATQVQQAATSTAGTTVLDASAGGTISFVSASGIYLDGIMRAGAGGAGAAGGTLRIQLDTEQYPNNSSDVVPQWALTPHRILVSQATQETPLPQGLQPGQADFLNQPGVAGQADISQQQIDAGGFGNVTLFARDQIAFSGSVSLHTSQSLTLEDYATSDTSLAGHVSVSSPYVLLAGVPTVPALDSANVYGIGPLLGAGGGLTASPPYAFSQLHEPCFTGAASCTGATFKVTADLIDLQNDIRFGATATPIDPRLPGGGTLTTTVDVPGFNAITLNSSGDIRFIPSNTQTVSTDTLNNLIVADDTLETSGNLALDAARVYPVTGVSAKIDAGLYVFGGTEAATTEIGGGTVFNAGTLTITGAGGATPQSPLSAFGTVSFLAGNVMQAGFVSAPLGAILLSGLDVTLEPNSVTTVSASGLQIPFGGTTDGVTYTYDGQTLSGTNPNTGNQAQLAPASYGAVAVGATSDPSNQGVQFTAQNVSVRQGAVIDVSGGGTLTGGTGEVVTSIAGTTTVVSQGFISGSGGSADALTTSLISFNASAGTATQAVASSSTNSGVGVYAILPDAGTSYAPKTLLDSSTNYIGSVPAVGEQVTIGAGVPGLAAGTYTLLPSYYALLPGAYRVQFNQGTTTATQVAANAQDGLTTAISGYLGVANTNIRNALPTTLLVTPAASVLRYSQYDQQSFADYATAVAAVFNTPRPYLPQDAGVIDFIFQPPSATGTNSAQFGTLALQFQGVAKLSPASGGYDGAVGIETTDSTGLITANGTGVNIDILGAGSVPVAGHVSIAATTIDALKAPLLEIGGNFGSNIGGSAGTGYLEEASTNAASVTLDPGARLAGGAVWLFAASQITISPGSTITTLGQTVTLPDSSTGVAFVGGNPNGTTLAGSRLNTELATATVGVANGDYVGYSPANGTGNVVIGAESTNGTTVLPATLISDNYIGIFGGGNISIASTTQINTADFEVSVPEINVGTVPQGAQAPAGYNLTQTAIDALLAGNAATGAPALQTLQLGASASLNFFGSVNFGSPGQSSFQTLVLTTPAIYGYGAAGDVATLSVNNLVWNGSSAPAGPVIASGPGTGAGTLQIDAQQITLGYPASSQPQNQTSQNRLIAGFANVDITGTSYISANNLSALSVYQSEGAYVPGSGNSFAGGNLTLATPLLTSAPGANLSVTAGGTLTLAAPSTTTTATTPPTGLGGAITLTAAAIADSTDVTLPGGKLVLDATGNIALGAGAHVNLAGAPKKFFDTTENVWGGTLSVESAAGNVSMAPSASINISAPDAAAGSIDITATAGTVSLAGSITGSATAGYDAGSIGIRAASITTLSALNTNLDAGGVFYARSFEQTGPGDITIGNEIQAQNVSVSADQGSITVTGTINASGAAPGTISLAAANGLTLASTAVLDAHGTVLQTDSTGAAIAAENTAEVALTVATGTLTIDPGAAINVSSPDGVARGDIELNVPRAATLGDANISAAGSIAITGAQTVAVNAFRTYTPSGGTIGQAYLDTVDADSADFINAAVSGGALTGALTGPIAAQLAGLSAYTSAFHLRPGVQIESTSDLTISGDINLAGYRYASVNPATSLTGTAGSGEPGVLWLRAGGNLYVNGSVTDGFAAPPATPDDNGWVLQSGTNSTTDNLILGTPVTLAGLDAGLGTSKKPQATTFPIGDYALNYQVTVANGEVLAANAVAPVALVLSGVISTQGSNAGSLATSFQNEFVLNGTLTLANGTTYLPGQVVPTTVSIVGATISAGTTLPAQASVSGVAGTAGITLPAGTNFDIFAPSGNITSVALQSSVVLTPGDLIPAATSLAFAGGASSIDTRPNAQGQIFAVAPLLPAGDLSWSLRLVSGANLGAADSTAVLASSTLAQSASAQNPDPGSLVLSDLHFAEQQGASTPTVGTNIDFSVLRTGTGYLDLVSGGSITESTLFGVYTAGTQSSAGTQVAAGSAALGAAGAQAGANGVTYDEASAFYQLNYPAGGGNLVVSAQKNITGNTYLSTVNGNTASNITIDFSSDLASQFIWWQGSNTQPGSWWINFGSYVPSFTSGGATSDSVYLTGFTGFGTLGGGNATISAGGNIGASASNVNSLTVNGQPSGSSGALDAAVASTGLVDQATGQLAVNGGGTLRIVAGGAINSVPYSTAVEDLNGAITDLRGGIGIRAGSIGTIVQTFAPQSEDPRPQNPFVSETFAAAGGPSLVLGDASVTVQTRGDQVISAVGDPTALGNTSAGESQQFQLSGQTNPTRTTFSLWQSGTSVTLASLGGSIVPIGTQEDGNNDTAVSPDNVAGVINLLYPPSLYVTAFSGNIDLGSAQTYPLELSPSATGQLQMIAGNSIYDGGYLNQVVVDISGASPTLLPTPQAPSYTQTVSATNTGTASVPGIFTAADPDIATGLLHQGDSQPALIYAVSGDILGLLSGQTNFASGNALGIIAGKALQVRAGNDVIGFGVGGAGENGSPSIVLNNNASDISTIQAGQDVIYADLDIYGPGLLQVQAGRNVYQGDIGSLISQGETGQALTVATRDNGAGITVLAGVGASGPALTAFANLYLNPANLANPDTPLQDQPGKVERTYATQLLAWLQSRFGYAGTASGALAYFLALPEEQQTAFLLTVYFDELNQSGIDRNDPASRFYHSYLEGEEAITALFPGTDLTGKSPASGGSITLFSGGQGDPAPNNASIQTRFGGGITTVVPFGQTSLGNYGIPPGGSAGITTQGSGDINMYSYGSVVLGQSRVLTTFGGSILIWLSSDGEINAGRGSKSTVLSTPIGISYDNYANVTLSPTVPSSGAGIGTISPIPQVPPGNLNLIAPVGTVNAGEAGIRASGNANIAALTLVNGSNIQVSGKTTGVPTVSAPSSAAQAAASGAAGAQTAAATQANRAPPAPEPSIIEVEVLSVSGGSPDEEERKRRKRASGA